MRFANSDSWEIAEDEGWQPTVALYVRDRLGLTDQIGVPPLVPTVAAEGHHARHADSWQAWFQDLVNVDSPVRADPREIERKARESEFFMLVADMMPAASAWASLRKREHIEEFRRRPHEQRLVVNRLVDDVTRTLGRKPAPFRLHITVLPVAGFWTYRATAGHLLVSRATHNDPVRKREALEPILLEIA
jgi:hypothetical protein